jgi:hypothetical protein
METGYYHIGEVWVGIFTLFNFLHAYVIQNSGFKVIPVLAGYGAGIASGASRLVKEKAYLAHNDSSFDLKRSSTSTRVALIDGLEL